MKKSFTLIELVIVILLTSIVYYLAFSNFNSNYEKMYKVKLIDIKNFMLKNFIYKERLSLICINDNEFPCYIIIDGNLNKDIKVNGLFKDIPEIYHYNKNLDKYEFSKIRLEEIDYDVFFELKFNKDSKHNNIIVDTFDDNIYLFSSIINDVIKFKSTNEIIEKFYNKEIEVKDAL